MAETVLKNVKIYLDGYDLSGDMNSATLSYSADLLDNTVFGDKSRGRIAGLNNVEFTADGFWNADTTGSKIDNMAMAEIGTSDAVLSIIPQGTALGNVAYFTKGLVGEYSPSGKIGDMFGYTMAAYGEAQPLVRGRLMEIGSLSTTVTATVRNLGIRKPTQKLYASMHVLALGAAGNKTRVSVQTASSSGFTSPTTALKFSQVASSQVAEFKTTASSTIDSWFRIRISTTAGSAGSGFTGAINVGIK